MSESSRVGRNLELLGQVALEEFRGGDFAESEGTRLFFSSLLAKEPLASGIR